MFKDQYVLRISDFRNYILGRLSASFAFNMLNTIVGWQVYELTKDYFALGKIGLSVIIPFMMVSLFSGYVADVVDRRLIIRICYAALAICMLVFYLLNTVYIEILKAEGVSLIYFLMFCTGVIRGFMSPAQSAFSAQLVPRENYTQASTWSTIVWHTSAVGGPAIAGLMYAQAGAPNTYLTMFLLEIVAFIFLFFVAKKPLPELSKNETMAQSLREGLKFVFAHQIILGSITLDMFSVLFGGAVAMLPAFAEEVLKQGPQGLGFLRAAPAIGALLMGFYMTQHSPEKNAGKKLLWTIAGFGVCTIVFALSNNFYVSMLALAGTGAFDNVSMVIRGAIMQLYTPDDMRGRVGAVNGIFIGASNELGEFESGSMAKAVGLIPSVVVGGILTLCTVGITAAAAPNLRNLDLKK
jgi:MFS family permease